MSGPKFLKRVFILTLGVLASCTGYSITGGPGKTVTPSLLSNVSGRSDLLGVNSLLVLPIDFGEKLRGISGDSTKFYKELHSAVDNELSLEFISGDEVLSKMRDLKSRIQRSEALNLGKYFKTDAVLVTELHEYAERMGSGVGANSGAGVDFSMTMYRTNDGKEI